MNPIARSLCGWLLLPLILLAIPFIAFYFVGEILWYLVFAGGDEW